MELDIIGLLCALSYALDCVEGELLKVTTGHGKRVAYLSICMAKELGIQGDALQDLAACALLHDNALTQYIAEEYHNDLSDVDVSQLTVQQIGRHCILGEANGKYFPFRTDVSGVILYHHENADGSGPFQKKADDVHPFARLVHLADLLDTYCHFGSGHPDVWQRTQDYLNRRSGTAFDSETVSAFFRAFQPEHLARLNDSEIDSLLWKTLPRSRQFYSFEALRRVTTLFAKITDYKSEFTSRHSLGVAEHAAQLGAYLHEPPETVEKLYIAGALHDLGKLAIGNDILEKPAKLTQEEFSNMKNHAWYTYAMLSQVDGFEEITSWASLHHEKLDGSGYPFGKTAAELGPQERLMACIDIYQALTEPRPYKDGFSHDAACKILRELAERNQIDSYFVEAIADCFAPDAENSRTH